LSEFNKVVFEVAYKCNKKEIKGAVEKLFSVKVKSVNIINIKGKIKRFKGVLGKRNDIKKAVITLEEGNTIDISAGV
jgi:large subunit ribosomal protein L23